MKQKLYLLTSLTIFAGGLFLSSLSHAETADGASINWMVDFDEAMKIAVKEDKPIFLYFTGSKWCGPCIALQKEVYSKKVFIEYANKEFIPVKVDFSPRGEAAASEFQKQHDALFDAFAEGFPTVVLIMPEGRVISPFYGYRRGGPLKYIEYLKGLLAES